MANFDLANIALQSVFPSNEIALDDKGMPSVMVKIPKMSWKELGVGESDDPFPAFVNGDKTKDFITVGKYQCVVQNGRAYSLPCRDPAHDINYDESFLAVKSKGGSWHMMTRFEWIAIALWCLKIGYQPKGNTYWGVDHEKGVKEAIHSPDAACGRTLTGTGPVSWAHNGELSGIFDMCGNVWEWTTGMRLVYGELQVLSRDGTFDNCAEDTSLSVAADSPYWWAVDGTNGNLIKPNGSGTTVNSIKLSWVDNHWRWTTGTIVKVTDHGYATFFSTDCDNTISAAAQLKLIALGCLKPAKLTEDPGDGFWARNQEAERLPIAGGDWSAEGWAGLFALLLHVPRSHRLWNVGFRSAL